jgi:hypothetical protein
MMSGDTRRATGFLDLEAWPPKQAVNRAEYAVSFDNLPDGRVVVCSMLTNPPGEYAVRIHPADWPLDPDAGPAEVYPLPGGLTLAEVWVVSGRVVTFGTLIKKSDPPGARRAYLLAGGKFVPAPGLPPVGAFTRDSFGHQLHTNGKVTLADGEEILVWDGAGYRWTGKRFVPCWPLGAKEPGGIDEWVSVPWGRAGLFYVSGWKLVYARRGEKPVRVQPDAGDVLHICAGPEDSVILSLIRNTKRHVARVWYPAEGTYVPLMRGHLDWKTWVTSGRLDWSAATGRVYVSPWHTFPESDLLELKPVQPRGKGYLVPKP